MSLKTYWALLILLVATILSSMPPHPLKQDNSAYPGYSSLRNGVNAGRSRVDAIPQTVLAIMVEFDDVKFDDEADYPDYLVHDSTYVDAAIRHLQEYWQDASHGAYIFNYDVYDRITLSKNMSYYGDDDHSERTVEMVEEMIDALDPNVDFNSYDAYIIFHAGAGQESDIYDANAGTIWSTFVNYWDLKEYYDPDDENPDFQGNPTDDGCYMVEFSIVPESQWQVGFDEDDPILGILGVLAHEFGHQLGLPTLYDNYSGNGRSSGIGNFGVMGTGAWNALGYVPPMPCAWSRCYLGWETPIEITENFADAQVDYILSQETGTTRVYKIPITDKEYFLIENRQQNPDNSVSQATGEPSFTFPLLAEGQDYYPEGHPNAGDPKFNMIKNSYLGCEWDFYLPGYGGPEVPVTDPNSGQTSNEIIDGSGILIWHIDEYVIEANFTPDFEYNTVNATAKHKGVDLEEADGVQHMDSYYPDPCRTGSPRDAFREDNNTYFGLSVNPETGLNSLPTAESYYGGSSVEVLDIGPSDLVMQFSVRFEWNLDTGYAGGNPFGAQVGDFDEDGNLEIFYPMPDGELYFWRNDERLVGGGFPDDAEFQGSIDQIYAYDELTDTFIIPGTINNGPAYTYIFTPRDSTDINIEVFSGKSWASHPVVLPEAINGCKALLPLHSADGLEIQIMNNSWNIVDTWNEADSLKSNLIYDDDVQKIVSFHHPVDGNWFMRTRMLADPFNPSDIAIDELSDVETLLYALSADIDPSVNGNEIILLSSDYRLFLLDENGNVLPNFPLMLPESAYGCPTMADVDINGTLDMVLGAENFILVAGYNGEILNAPIQEIELADTLGIAGQVIAVNLDNDDELEILGNLSLNRFCVFGEYYAIEESKSYSSRSRNCPVLAPDGAGGITAYIPSDYGRIFRYDFPNADADILEDVVWNSEYGNTYRTGSWIGDPVEAPPASSKLFGDVYIFPNPVNDVYPNDPTLNIGVTRDVEVKVRMYDIAGNLVYNHSALCNANMPNRDKFFIKASKLSSGLYFIIVEADGDIKKLKFGVEK